MFVNDMHSNAHVHANTFEIPSPARKTVEGTLTVVGTL